MNIFKPHFWYNKSQRNGVFFLMILIVAVQIVIVSFRFSSDEIIVPSKTLAAFQKEVDSLKAFALKERQPKIYPFNPNYITDFKGHQLGMSLDEIDRLFAFRKTNKFINSAAEFQRVTQVSDSLLAAISIYFKFPDWVVRNHQQQKGSNKSSNSLNTKTKKPKISISTSDLNKATAADLQSVNGIGPAFSERIIKYRSKLQGFSLEEQLYEVWGLEKNVADNVLKVFKISIQPTLVKQNVNTVLFKELLKNPYIDYELCKKIFSYRDEVAELQNINELKNIEGFPLEKYHRIVLYLEAK